MSSVGWRRLDGKQCCNALCNQTRRCFISAVFSQGAETPLCISFARCSYHTLECILNTNWNSSRKRTTDCGEETAARKNAFFHINLFDGDGDVMCWADGGALASAQHFRCFHHHRLQSCAFAGCSAYAIACYVARYAPSEWRSSYKNSLLSWFQFWKLFFLAPRFFFLLIPFTRPSSCSGPFLFSILLSQVCTWELACTLSEWIQ